MAIGSAIQRGSNVYVYDEKGTHRLTKPGELVGYTSSTISVRRGNVIYTYDEKGVQRYAKSAG